MLRLVEHRPAWEVHAFLRTCGISYRVDYSPAPTALGKVLPVIIDEEGVYNGADLFECIQRHSRTSLPCREEQTINELVSSTLRNRFDALWTQLDHYSDGERNDSLRAAPFTASIYLGFLYDMQKLFSSNRFDTHPTVAVEDLVDRLLELYTEIDAYLQDHTDTSIVLVWPFVKEHFEVFSNDKKTRVEADALLFGFVVKALAHPLLAKEVYNLPNLMHFVKSIAKTSFGSADSCCEDESWKISLYRLLENSFIKGNEDYDEVVEILSFPGLIDYASHCYPSRSDTVVDLPSEFNLPKLPEFSLESPDLWERLKTSPDSNTISVAGLIFMTTVAAMVFAKR